MVQQHVVVLVGLPGSGKTTLAKRITAANSSWVWINQDMLGDRPACEQLCRQALAAGKHVIIDRSNSDAQQRSTWVRIAREICGSGARLLAVVLDVPVHVCKQRAMARADHPTLSPFAAAEVIDRLAALLAPVGPREGLQQVLHLADQQAADQLVARLAALPAAAAAAAAQQQQQPTGPAHTSAGHQAGGGGAAFGSQQRGAQMLSYQQQQQHFLEQQLMQQQQQGWGTGMWGMRPMQQQHALFNPYAMRPVLSTRHVHQVISGQQQQQQQQCQHESRSVHQPLPPQPSATLLQTAAVPAAVTDNLGRNDVTAAASDGTRCSGSSSSDLKHRSKSVADGLQQQEPSTAGWQQGVDASTVQRLLSARPNSNPEAPELVALYASQLGPLDASEPADERIILLFDLNGCLTARTKARQQSGRNALRPGTRELLHLKRLFRLGIYTSATVKTAHNSCSMLEAEAGEQLFERGLVLYRSHTAPAPEAHVQAGGSKWDTIKPISKWFSRPHRVLLVDDDAFKALPGEEANMVQVPCWDGSQDCSVLRHLAAAVQELLGGAASDTDVRQLSSAISQRIVELQQQEQLVHDPDAIEIDDGSEGEHQQAEQQGDDPCALVIDEDAFEGESEAQQRRQQQEQQLAMQLQKQRKRKMKKRRNNQLLVPA